MDVHLFDFELPEQLIAQTPLVDRSSSRLLTLNKATGEVRHQQFVDLLAYVKAGDLLVLNDTRVIPARLFGVKRDTGAKAEVLLLKPLGDDRWEALVRPGKRIKAGTELIFGQELGQCGALLEAFVEEEGNMGARVVKFRYQGIFNEILDKLGQMPLPPYIKERLSDQERYQTVYAKHQGSSAAPTAGLHFTSQFLDTLKDKGVELAYVTLHVGLGTFRPVSVSRIEDHEMHAEFYDVPKETADRMNVVKSNGGRIIAVGTTSARTIESAARACLRSNASPSERGAYPPSDASQPELSACHGWTDIFIYPGYQFRAVDALLTNFHLPQSTLLMLVSALAGTENVLHAYREAVKQQYRFFSFGDAMLIY